MYSCSVQVCMYSWSVQVPCGVAGYITTTSLHNRVDQKQDEGIGRHPYQQLPLLIDWQHIYIFIDLAIILLGIKVLPYHTH